MKNLFNYEPDAEYLLKTVEIKLTKKYGVIIDFSNSHGLCFGIVFPNTRGNSERTDNLPIEWFDPEQVEFL